MISFLRIPWIKWVPFSSGARSLLEHSFWPPPPQHAPPFCFFFFLHFDISFFLPSLLEPPESRGEIIWSQVDSFQAVVSSVGDSPTLSSFLFPLAFLLGKNIATPQFLIKFLLISMKTSFFSIDIPPVVSLFVKNFFN